jgi:SAM-dependent methyltransferase
MNRPFTEIEQLAACPLCGSKALRRAFVPDVDQCAECQVFFRNPRPTQEDIRKSYNEGAVYAEWSQSDPAQKTAMWRRRLNRIIPLKPGSRLLDVGAGDGFFLDLARAAGYDTCGTELSETGAALAKARGHDLRIGQIGNLDFGGQRFDVITLWHVLEHVPNPGRVLDAVLGLLAPGGILALAVPNEENRLFRHRLGLLRVPNPLGPLTWGQEIHLTHFQPATLRRALTSRGAKLLREDVDDIYGDRRLSNLAKLGLQKSLLRLTGWHFSMAMMVICTPAPVKPQTGTP